MKKLIWLLGLLVLLGACNDSAPQAAVDRADARVNLIQNGGFDSGKAPWQMYNDPSKNITYQTKVDEFGHYCVWVGEGGDAAWNVTLAQDGLSLQKDVTYTLNFDVLTTKNEGANFSVKVGEASSPYSPYSETQHEVAGNQSQAKSVNIEMPVDDAAARLEFHLGGNPYGQYYCFDNVSLNASQTDPAPNPEPAPEPAPEPNPDPSPTPAPNPDGGNPHGGTLAPDQIAADKLISELYTKWKNERLAYAPAKGLQAGEIILTSNTQFGGGMVSEGLGYGLLLSVYNDDKATFDGLWKFVKRNLENYEGGEGGLLPYLFNSSSQVINSANATDGDLDIAFALIVADKKGWGYGADAKTYIANILRYSVGDGSNGVPDTMLKRGYWQNDPQEAINTSYVSPGYFKVFADYSGNERWLAVRDYNYEILEKGLGKHTLLPHDVNVNGDKIGTHEEFDVDAARGPWRLATDYAWYGDSRAKTLLTKYNQFFESAGLSNLCSDYYTNGSPETNWCGSQAGWMIGGAASAQLASSNNATRGEAWTALTKAHTGDYYSFELMQLGILLTSGRFYNPLR